MEKENPAAGDNDRIAAEFLDQPPQTSLSDQRRVAYNALCCKVFHVELFNEERMMSELKCLVCGSSKVTVTKVEIAGKGDEHLCGDCGLVWKQPLKSSVFNGDINHQILANVEVATASVDEHLEILRSDLRNMVDAWDALIEDDSDGCCECSGKDGCEEYCDEVEFLQVLADDLLDMALDIKIAINRTEVAESFLELLPKK